MMLFAELSLLAFWCLGLVLASGPGMILERPHDWWERVAPDWLFKPTIGCVYCMASVHGTIIHAGAVLFFGADPWLLPAVVIPGVAANGLLYELYELIKKHNA